MTSALNIIANLAVLEMVCTRRKYSEFRYGICKQLVIYSVYNPFGDLYRPSVRPYQGLPDVEYPFHDKTITVTACGRICIDRKKIHLSTVFAGQNVGVRQVEDRVWLVSFMDYDLGYFDLDSCKVEPLENPFGPKVLTM